MIRGIDIVFAISITLKIIINQLGLIVVLIIVYINLYSFYKYLVKLKTTKKKHLMIDIIAIR
jgi:hypothetical protein